MTIDACICENCLAKNHCDVLPYSNNCNEVRAMAEHDREVYNKAIDDFVNDCEKRFTTMFGQRYVDKRDIREIAEQLKEGKEIIPEKKYNSGWIPCDERLPENDTYILLSFENFSVPCIGRYEVDEDNGGAFYPGDEDKSYSSYGLFVNAWMPLPEPLQNE